jgi:hypothetical protein
MSLDDDIPGTAATLESTLRHGVELAFRLREVFENEEVRTEDGRVEVVNGVEAGYLMDRLEAWAQTVWDRVLS